VYISALQAAVQARTCSSVGIEIGRPTVLLERTHWWITSVLRGRELFAPILPFPEELNFGPNHGLTQSPRYQKPKRPVTWRALDGSDKSQCSPLF